MHDRKVQVVSMTTEQHVNKVVHDSSVVIVCDAFDRGGEATFVFWPARKNAPTLPVCRANLHDVLEHCTNPSQVPATCNNGDLCVNVDRLYIVQQTQKSPPLST